VVSFLVALDVWFTLTRTYRRRGVAGPSGADSMESMSTFWRRIARVLGPHILAWAALVGGFWAIIHFGPLRPIHEWFT
jgi:hypothetical protein